ncbi:MAG: ankyrin repeat domain-containing protein [Caldilineaceae bacterium]
MKTCLHDRSAAITWIYLCLALASCKPADSEIVDAVQTGDEPRTKALLERGANPNAQDLSGLKNNLLCIAARGGHLGIIRALLQRGASQWHEPIRCAITARQAEATRVLAKASGANGVQRGTPPLTLAAQQCHMPVIDALLSAGASVNGGKARHIYPPLVTAAEKGHLACVRKFLAAGADVDRRDPLGCSALFYAASKGLGEIAKLLLEHCADPTLPNAAGHTAAFRANWLGHDAIVALFRAKGITDFGLRPPYKGGIRGPKVRVPHVEVRAAGGRTQ